MSIFLQRARKIGPIVTLLLSSALLLTPFFFNPAMIIGSDAIFHFNRLYDTAMQIKHGNFQYFIAMYGFQSSGRIVNALYGPFMAYLQGFIVLISPSWFGYQVLSNGLLYFLSGLSLYLLLKKAGVRIVYRVPLGILYMTTYSVQYWTLRQGFSSWGAALFPICLIPLIDLIQKRTLHPMQTAMCIGVMCQIHMLSAFLLIFVYTCFFITTFFSNGRMVKFKLIKQVEVAILIFGFLILNVIYSYFVIYGRNNVAQPFVNKWMADTTIFRNSSYWLVYPPILIIVVAFVVWQVYSHWSEESQLLKVTTVTCTSLFILCTDIFPWRLLNNLHIKLIEIIQFPFRFFVPFTVLLLLVAGLILEKWHTRTAMFATVSYGLLLVSLFQTGTSTNNALKVWHNNKSYLKSSVHSYFTVNNNQKVKKSFFIKNKEKALTYIVKTTPDYLPIKNLKGKNKYALYYRSVINKQKFVHKYVQRDKLIIEWQGNSLGNVQVPVIKYEDTVLILNHKRLNSNVKVNEIGAPIVKQQRGKNLLMVYYRKDSFLNAIIIITFISWIIVFYMNYKLESLDKKI